MERHLSCEITQYTYWVTATNTVVYLNFIANTALAQSCNLV